MIRKHWLNLIAIPSVLAVAACADLQTQVPAWGPDLVAVTQSNKLITFNHKSPGTLESASKISGVQSGEDIVAIDYRPSDGKLYGLGGAGNLYVLDVNSGAAEFKSRLHASPGDAFAGLSGQVFDIDFEPVAGFLTVVSNDGQNLRVNADTGETMTQQSFDPQVATVVAVAYTTKPNGAFKTTEYAVNSKAKEISSVPWAGNTNLVTVGAIGTDIGNYAGFDIKGNEAGGTAYAAFSVPDSTTSKLYLIGLGSGSAKGQGTIGEGKEKVRSLAIRLSLSS